MRQLFRAALTSVTHVRYWPWPPMSYFLFLHPPFHPTTTSHQLCNRQEVICHIPPYLWIFPILMICNLSRFKLCPLYSHACSLQCFLLGLQVLVTMVAHNGGSWTNLRSCSRCLSCIKHNTSAAASSEWRHSQIPLWHSLSDFFMAFKVYRVVLLSSVYYNCVSKISGSGLLIMHIIIYIYCYKIINCKFNLIFLQRIFGL